MEHNVTLRCVAQEPSFADFQFANGLFSRRARLSFWEVRSWTLCSFFVKTPSAAERADDGGRLLQTDWLPKQSAFAVADKALATVSDGLAGAQKYLSRLPLHQPSR